MYDGGIRPSHSSRAANLVKGLRRAGSFSSAVRSAFLAVILAGGAKSTNHSWCPLRLMIAFNVHSRFPRALIASAASCSEYV